MTNPMDLTGKKILVAGAGSELGAIVASKLNDLGANLILIDTRFPDENIQNSKYFTFQIHNNLEIKHNISRIAEENGPFDGFVYSSGIGDLRPLALTKLENLADMMNANFYSFVEIVRLITRKKYFNKGGSIVAISSISSIKGLKTKLAYAASKAALDASIRTLAAELGEKGIRVNSILKAALTIDKNIDYIKNVVDFNDESIISKQLLGLTQPEELANLVAFLLSDSVKTLTGTGIILDGGYSIQ